MTDARSIRETRDHANGRRYVRSGVAVRKLLGGIAHDAPKVAGAVRGMDNGDPLQDAAEQGSMDQQAADTTRIVAVCNAIEAGKVMYRDDLTGDALNARKVRKARKPESEYVLQVDWCLRQGTNAGGARPRLC